MQAAQVDSMVLVIWDFLFGKLMFWLDLEWSCMPAIEQTEQIYSLEAVFPAALSRLSQKISYACIL